MSLLIHGNYIRMLKVELCKIPNLKSLVSIESYSCHQVMSRYYRVEIQITLQTFTVSHSTDKTCIIFPTPYTIIVFLDCIITQALSFLHSLVGRITVKYCSKKNYTDRSCTLDNNKICSASYARMVLSGVFSTTSSSGFLVAVALAAAAAALGL